MTAPARDVEGRYVTAIQCFENGSESCIRGNPSAVQSSVWRAKDGRGKTGVESYLVAEPATEVGTVLVGLCCSLCSSQVEPSLPRALLPVLTMQGASWTWSGFRPPVVKQSSYCTALRLSLGCGCPPGCGLDSFIKDQHHVRRRQKPFSPPLRLSSLDPMLSTSFPCCSSK